jgi:3-hydroxyisobutyrate dehydrogenase-like beta-hydroxyacid dehydrogenase
MLSHNFQPGFRIELQIKDMANALDATHSSYPFAAAVL